MSEPAIPTTNQISQWHYTLRALPSMFRTGLAQVVAYRAEMIIWMFTTNMPLVMLALWSAVARSGPVAGYTQNDFTAYYLTTLVVRLMTGCWVVYELTMEIRGGTLSMRLLRPVHPLIAHAMDNLAAMPMRIVVSSPIIAALLITSHAKLTSDWLLWLLVPISVLGGWLIIFNVMAMVGTLALYVESAMGLFSFWLGLSSVLSGYLVPLDLFPARVRAIALCLPFRFTLSFPVELVLGRVDRYQAFELLAAQWGYVALGVTGTLLLWRAGMRRYGAFGG